MAFVESLQQRSARKDGPEAVDRDTVIVFTTGVRHGPSCGERVGCPAGCESRGGPGYRPAERFVRGGGIYIVCNLCDHSWREIRAAA